MGNDRKNTKEEMILRLALAEELEQDLDVLKFLPDSELEETHVFSPDHEKKMKKIFRMARKAEHKPERRKRVVRAAACIVVFCGVSAVTISSVDAFRIPILSFFADVKEKATQYQVTKRENYPLTKAFAEHEPGYIVEGFNVDSIKEEKDFYSIIYINDVNNLWYEVNYRNSHSTVSLDTEKSESQEDEINNHKTIIVNKNGKLRITMYMNSAHVILSGTISWDEAKKILESMR